MGRIIGAIFCAAGFIVLPGLAAADETGFAGSHTWRKEGGRTCFADHVHSGSGEGATKETARAVAARDWANFVNFEYGSDWARFSKASGVSVRYTKAEKGWTAWIDGRPCK